jgi:hypothetical protein
MSHASANSLGAACASFDPGDADEGARAEIPEHEGDRGLACQFRRLCSILGDLRHVDVGDEVVGVGAAEHEHPDIAVRLGCRYQGDQVAGFTRLANPISGGSLRLPVAPFPDPDTGDATGERDGRQDREHEIATRYEHRDTGSGDHRRHYRGIAYAPPTAVGVAHRRHCSNSQSTRAPSRILD